ncbi:MAG TPA: hypothetical protein VHZ06_10260 [Marmoricola sp.]|jgi:hypothetical protein|nr:hypothetical protein [Marmoricola sp.]
MTVSPQSHVSTPPTLAEVLEAAKAGAGVIGRLEIVDATPITPVPQDAGTHEALVEEVIESLTVEVPPQAISEAAAPAAASPDERRAALFEPETHAEDVYAIRDDEHVRAYEAHAAAVQKSLDEILPRLLADIADLERCVQRANDEADRAARHLEQARSWVARIVAAADVSPSAPVVRLALPGQRATVAAELRPDAGEDGPVTRNGRW